MGANSVLRLLFQISADPSKAQEAISQFEKSTSTSLHQVVDKTEEMNKSLLNSHNSVHLLTEEMGIHLPRAVVGAISEMLPHIGDLGGALLGAFAIEKVTEWGKEAFDVVKDLQSGVTAAVDDIGKAAEEAAKRAHAQIASIYSDFKTTAEGQLPMEEVDEQTAKLTKYYGAFLDLQKAENAMQRPSAETMKIVSQAVAEGLTNIEDVQSKLNAMAALQSEQHKRYAELVKSESKAVCDAVTKDQEKMAKAAHDAAKAQQQQVDAYNKGIGEFLTLERQWFARQQEMIHLIDENTAAMNAEAAQEQRLKEIQTTVMQIGEAQLPLQRQEAQNLQILAAHTADLTEKTVHLNAVRREELEIMQALNVAGDHEAKATKKDLVEAAQSAAAGLAGLIAGQRAAAAVNAVFDAAKGAEQVAMALDPVDPNHAMHWISAAQFFVASAEFAKIAGTSSHHHGGGGGGSAGRGSSGGFGSSGGYGRGSGYRDQPPPQTLAAGAAGGGGRFSQAHVVVYSSDDELAKFVGDAVKRAVQNGHYVMSTASQRGVPVGH